MLVKEKELYQEYIFKQEVNIKNEIANMDSSDKKISNAPKFLGISSFFISLIAIPYTYIVSSLLIAKGRGYSTKDTFNLLSRKSPYITAPIIISMLFAILILCIGVGAFILSFISIKHLKASYVGFFICSLLYCILIYPSKGASLIQFVLCLVAGFISYKNYKEDRHE